MERLCFIKDNKNLWEIIKNDPAYSVLIPKEYLAMGFDGTVYPNILKELD